MFRKNQEASLLDLDSGSSVNLLKQAPPLLETAQDVQQPEFDQILDLTNNSNEDGGDNLLAPPPLATPLIAFEDSINTSPKQEVPTAGKFLIILDLRDGAKCYKLGVHGSIKVKQGKFQKSFCFLLPKNWGCTCTLCIPCSATPVSSSGPGR